MKNVCKVILIVIIFVLSACQSYDIKRGDTGITIGETEQVDLEKKEQTQEIKETTNP